MKIKYSYDSVADVPQMFKDSYTEQDGKFVLTGEIDVKTQEDIDKVLGAKQHIDKELGEVKEQLKLSQKEALESKSKVEVLELQIKDGADPAKLQELVETKVKVATEELTKQLAERDERIGDFQNKIYGAEKEKMINGIVGNFSDSVKDEANFILNNIFERQEDGTFLTKNAFGLDAGLNSEQVVSKLTQIRPHWGKQNTPSNQGGATGGDGSVKNPFSKESFNRTEQHKLMLENPSLASSLKAQAEKE